MNFQPNTPLGRYLIQERIGEGGRGIVYRAIKQEDETQSVAIKLFPRSLTFNANARASFKDDLDQLNQLPDPHIIPIYEYGQTNEQVWVAMRYMPSGNLQQKHAQKPLKYRHLFTLYQQIVPALQMVHDAGMVHGNLKPTNILFNGRAPAISDFGLQQGMVAGSGLTRRNQLLDTRWLSPEQIRDERLTGATDVYTMGTLLYWMLFGKFPFEATTQSEMAEAHLSAPIPQVGNELDRLLQKSLAKRPEDRFTSIIDFSTRMPLSLSEPQPLPEPEPKKKWWKRFSG